MPNLEIPDELAEQIADWCMAYGAGPEEGDHPDDCKCRMCFVEMVARRIRQAVDNEDLLKAKPFLKQRKEATHAD